MRRARSHLIRQRRQLHSTMCAALRPVPHACERRPFAASTLRTSTDMTGVLPVAAAVDVHRRVRSVTSRSDVSTPGHHEHRHHPWVNEHNHHERHDNDDSSTRTTKHHDYHDDHTDHDEFDENHKPHNHHGELDDSTTQNRQVVFARVQIRRTQRRGVGVPRAGINVRERAALVSKSSPRTRRTRHPYLKVSQTGTPAAFTTTTVRHESHRLHRVHDDTQPHRGKARRNRAPQRRPQHGHHRRGHSDLNRAYG